MSLFEVLAPGLLTTVQDLGRESFGPLGVSASGAADPVSLRIGNRLLANPEGAAALEMTLLGGEFAFPQRTIIALAGADFGATVNERPIEPWQSAEIQAGEVLRLGSTRASARCYLCVQGGFAVKPVLGSASTHLLSGLGGLEGRPLRKGDVLKIASGPGSFRTFRRRRVSRRALEKLALRKSLRVTLGPQAAWFPQESQAAFYESTFRVTEESNRMGIRLEGAKVLSPPGGNMLSEGVSLGAVQIPAGGSPIILFVEQQTTGGYPKLANVISADFRSLGQLRPRDEIRFERVELPEALGLLADLEKLLISQELFLE